MSLLGRGMASAVSSRLSSFLVIGLLQPEVVAGPQVVAEHVAALFHQ
ncbi:hypothetical protein [Cobetia sp. Dlab-2-U]|nr:hypothetical protein [Cobetia sp. Dlab-2-U]MCO7237355.1 hypothetical protein [Cobetia sp. Dlab-2-U]